MSNYKVIVSHPGKQHSFQLASELNRHDMLYKYATTVYDKESSLLMKFLKKILRGDDLNRASSRRNEDLQDSQILQYCEIAGFIEIFLARYDKSGKIYCWWQQNNADHFGIKIAKYAIQNNVDAVITFDTNARSCFKYLKEKAPKILRVMDVSAANRLYMRKIYESDFKKAPLFADKLRKERNNLWDEKFKERLKQEIAYTDIFLAPSEFVKKSLMYSDVSEDKIKVCPYGANFAPEKVNRVYDSKRALRAIYVGNVTEMKGIYYLLEAVRRINYKDIDLTVVGNYDNSDHVFDQYIDLPNFHFWGRVAHDKVKDYLHQADIFVFPSLGEGLSLSVLEALSCGLPCIVTKNSGANDVIEDYKNGFVINIQNIQEIQERLEWCIEHREDLSEMSDFAVQAAQKYSWKNHERILVKTIQSGIEEKQRIHLVSSEEIGRNVESQNRKGGVQDNSSPSWKTAFLQIGKCA